MKLFSAIAAVLMLSGTCALAADLDVAPRAGAVPPLPPPSRQTVYNAPPAYQYAQAAPTCPYAQQAAPTCPYAGAQSQYGGCILPAHATHVLRSRRRTRSPSVIFATASGEGGLFGALFCALNSYRLYPIL
jgi:hypothetical protein